MNSNDLISILGLDTSEISIAIYKGTTSPSFRKFVSECVVWCVSGIDWMQTPYAYQKAVGTDANLLEAGLSSLLSDYKLAGTFTLNFNHCDDDIEITGNIRELFNILVTVFVSEEIWATDFLIYSSDLRKCIEVYHEGFLTFCGSCNCK